ncbi:hypothetical protein [Marinicrinis sediminis]|uniref:Uncharacterized protein n=1 Tax=Marinicrinis sediminis TaxID=1652465 RepID=A0ABW5R953_9BACL
MKRKFFGIILSVFIFTLFILLVRSYNKGNQLNDQAIGAEIQLMYVQPYESIQSAFDLANTYKDEQHYRNLYFILRSFEQTVNALIQLNYNEIHQSISKEIIYDQTGASLYGAAPTVLLDPHINHSEVIIPLEGHWASFISNIKSGLFKQGDFDAITLAIEYYELVKKVNAVQSK